MAASQPLICASLHLPPDAQPFLRIHEISLKIILPNLDRLRLALEGTQDINPEATQIFYETRKVLREELRKVFQVHQLARLVAERYNKVLKALDEKNLTKSTLYEVNLGAEGGMDSSKEGQQAISVFRRELEKAVDRLATTTGVKHENSESSLTSAKNIQSVSEILTAINECNELLQQCHDQFALLEKQTRNENSIDSVPPSEEEILVMRAKWQTYFDAVKDVWMQGFEIANEITMPTSDGAESALESSKPKQNIPLWRALFQRQDKRDLVRVENVPQATRRLAISGAPAVTPSGSHEIQANVINPVDTMEGPVASENTGVPSAVPLNGPTSKNAAVPFWRRIFRRTHRNDLTPPTDTSERLEASDGTPDAPVPPAKVTFWRRLSRHATCLSTKLFQ